MTREANESYQFGNFRLEVGEHRLVRLDRPTNGTIPEKAFQTLVHLIRNSGTLLTKDELLNAVWPDAVVEENNLVKAIYAIRRFLDDLTGDPKYIETVPKHGYRFVAEVERLGTQQRARAASVSLPSVGFNSPAYDLYLRGRVKAGSENREDTEAAIEVLEAAVALDPNFAPAYAQLARAYNTRSFKFSNEDEAKLDHENAEVAILKALALDPDLAEGHFARGLILWTQTKGFPHEQVIRSYKRSLELDPTADETHHQLSMVYGHIGLLDEAMRSVASALDLNPNNTMARFRVSNYLAWQCRFDEAIAALKSVPSDVSPLLVKRITAEIFVQLARLDAAEDIVDDYLRSQPMDEGGSFTSVKALILAKRENGKEAVDAIQRAIEIGEGYGHFHHTAHNIASAYAALNEPAKAVNWLEAAADNGFPCYSYFEADPNLEALREFRPYIDLMSTLRRQWERFKEIA